MTEKINSDVKSSLNDVRIAENSEAFERIVILGGGGRHRWKWRGRQVIGGLACLCFVLFVLGSG